MIWDWTQVSQTIDERSIHKTNEPVTEIYIHNDKFGFSGIIVELNFLWNFGCTVLNDFVSK